MTRIYETENNSYRDFLKFVHPYSFYILYFLNKWVLLIVQQNWSYLSIFWNFARNRVISCDAILDTSLGILLFSVSFSSKYWRFNNEGTLLNLPVRKYDYFLLPGEGLCDEKICQVCINAWNNAHNYLTHIITAGEYHRQYVARPVHTAMHFTFSLRKHGDGCVIYCQWANFTVTELQFRELLAQI